MSWRKLLGIPRRHLLSVLSVGAKVYKDGHRMNIEVTNADGNTRATLVVNGSFSNPNSDLLLRFSKRAAGRLGIDGKCNIEIEPVAKR